ncbi:hypothetical protein PF003_g39154 [Phytophthora fragariae]|nr:hypothetical protein PF003_g39154 [Phytophthora fragariae]
MKRSGRGKSLDECHWCGKFVEAAVAARDDARGRSEGS